MSTSTLFVRAASREPRRMHAFPDLMQSAAASTATLGRASNTTITTPSGTRSFRTRIPFSSVKSRRTAPIGSGRSAIVSTPAAMAASRSGSSVSRSTIAAVWPDAPATSAALASSTSAERRSSAVGDPGQGGIPRLAVEGGENACGAASANAGRGRDPGRAHTSTRSSRRTASGRPRRPASPASSRAW